MNSKFISNFTHFFLVCELERKFNFPPYSSSIKNNLKTSTMQHCFLKTKITGLCIGHAFYVIFIFLCLSLFNKMKLFLRLSTDGVSLAFKIAHEYATMKCSADH